MSFRASKETHASDASLRLARVFDVVDANGAPHFLETHPILSDLDEVRDLAAYLNAGEVVMESPVLSVDILDPDLPEVVPLNVRTDGSWIWSDTTTYYLETYGIAPDPGLLVHLRARGQYSWEPNEEELEQIKHRLEEASAEVNSFGTTP